MDLEKPNHTAVRIVKDVTIYIPLEGLIDFGKEKEKIQKDKDKLTEQIGKLEQKLANPDYTGKAPAQVIERDRTRLAEWKNQLLKLVELQSTMP